MSDYASMTDDEMNIEIERRLGFTDIRREWDCVVLADMDTIYVGGEFDHYAGNYAGDMNAAVELLKDMPYWQFYRWPVKPIWECWSSGDDDSVLNEQPARAISEAYLLYTDTNPTPAMMHTAAQPSTLPRTDAHPSADTSA